jgi:hypothetical protein
VDVTPALEARDLYRFFHAGDVIAAVVAAVEITIRVARRSTVERLRDL